MSNQKPSTWEVLKSVLASFFGVQSERVRKRDFEHGSPGQFIVIGLVLTLVFILILYALVKTVLYLILV